MNPVDVSFRMVEEQQDKVMEVCEGRAKRKVVVTQYRYSMIFSFGEKAIP